MIVDDIIAGRSQWTPIAALKWICQVNGVKKLSERVAKVRRRDNVGMFWRIVSHRIPGWMMMITDK